VDEPYNGPRTSSTIDCNKSSSMAILHQQQKCYQEYHRELFSVHCFSELSSMTFQKAPTLRHASSQMIAYYTGPSSVGRTQRTCNKI
jgi:hypothetical protein